MTKFLGIETSTAVCSVALSCDARVVVEYTLELGSHHSERLQPMVEMALQEARLSVGDLDGVAVAAGPGSFTGLRIGMGLAKGLCRGAGSCVCARVNPFGNGFWSRGRGDADLSDAGRSTGRCVCRGI